MEAFERSNRNHSQYPENLISANTYGESLTNYHRRLVKDKDRLFSLQSNLEVNFWELIDTSTTAFIQKRIESDTDLAQQLHGRRLDGLPDPHWRFIFPGASNSRQPLKISYQMFTKISTYEQIMPEFLDFVFPFGKQEYALDSHFGAFRHEDCMSDLLRGPYIPELGRSGRVLQLCYNLRGVEAVQHQPHWPWSIRQTAVYHSFDVEKGRVVWIIMKGNKKIMSKLKKLTQSPNFTTPQGFADVGQCFEATLKVHAAVCDWVQENWRWYLNYLEDLLHARSRHALLIEEVDPELHLSEKAQLSRSHTTPIPVRQPTLTERGAAQIEKVRGVFSINPRRTGAQVPGSKVAPPWEPPLQQLEAPAKFSFRDLQELQDLEEKVTEANLVLKMNTGVLTELRDYYQSLVGQQSSCPSTIRIDREYSVMRFAKLASMTINELKMHCSRLDALLKLASNRKKLLFSILEHTNMEMNKYLTKKAQVSQDKMQRMTEYMQDVAVKTEKETISMRIITVVTLFFLPGTFVSTLMSTDIVRFPNGGEDGRQFSLGALRTFVAITVPIMLVTFIASISFQGLENCKTKRRRSKLEHGVEA